MSPAPGLDRITLAGPCSKRWQDLHGDGSKRFCDTCALHVHDLSSMSRERAEALLRERQGRLCVRYAMNSDGRVLTREDFTRPRLAWAAGWRTLAAAFFGLLSLLSGCRPARDHAPLDESSGEEAQPTCPSEGEIDPDALILLGYVGDE